MLTALNFPKADLKLSKKDATIFVWDIFRKKKLRLTPEEWVRQHTLHYLIDHKRFPVNLIASEYGVHVNTMIRRCDGVVFNRQGNPVMIIECKAPHVKIDEKTLHQVAQYNFALKVNWLVLTNGLETVTAFINSETKSIDYLEEIPSFEEVIV